MFDNRVDLLRGKVLSILEPVTWIKAKCHMDKSKMPHG